MAALKMKAIETSWGMISKLPRSTSPKMVTSPKFGSRNSGEHRDRAEQS